MLIKNANLISMSEERDKIEYGVDIRIKGKKIIKIDNEIPSYTNEMVINAKGKYVMPGLINTHAHVPMSVFRETIDGYNLQDWLNKKIWPMESKLMDLDIYYASYLSFVEMIMTGTTTVNDMYFMTKEIIRAARETGVRIQTSTTLMNKDGDVQGDCRIKELKNMIDDEHSYFQRRVTFNAGIHSLYTSTEDYIKKCINFANKEDLPIHMHFCENAKEIEDIKEIYKKNPIEVILDDFKDTKLILAHCVKIGEDEIQKFKERKNISVVHCPVSNLRLGCGIAPISELIKNGINVSLGTDGQGSGSNLDMFEVMKITALLQKGYNENPMVLPAYEVLKSATINGAKALGLEKEIGSIEEGKKADIIIFNLNNIITKPLNDIFSDIVYNVKGTDVETTIIDGEILKENGELLIYDNDIYDNCVDIIKRIKKEISKEILL